MKQRPLALRRLLDIALTLDLVLLAPGARQFALAQVTPEDDLRAAAADLERFTRALEASLDDLPRDSFDPESIVLDLVGFDVDDLFAWVRDNTAPVPYRGALRGPRGVLMDRVGNSLDRSLLLYDLLFAAGEEVRLVHGELSETEAQALFDELAAGDPAPAPQPVGNSDADLERYAAAGDVDVAQLHAAAEADAQFRELLRTELEERVADQAALLAELIALPAGGDAAAAVAALRDHWWVQWSDVGNWTDLDPIAAAPGVALTAVTETLQPLGLADLDASLLHTVTVRLVAECWDEGRLVRTELLASDPLLPAELLGSDLYLRHVPIGWPDIAPDDVEQGTDYPEQWLELAASIEHWVPVLRVGDASVVGLAVSEGCTFPTAASLTWPGAVVSETVEGATDLFETLPTGDVDDEAEVSSASLTAEWLEYELQVPGEAARVIRRPLFDRIGASTRADGGVEPSSDDLGWKLALLGQTDILLQPYRLSDAYVERLLGEAILANRDALLTAAREAELGPSDTLTEALEGLSFLPAQLYALVLAHQADMAPEAYIASPNILSHHSQLRRDDGGFATVQSFDIVANEIEIHPSAPSEAAWLRLQQGVRDTNAEALLASTQCQAVRLEGIGCAQRPNAAGRLASGDGAWALVASTDALEALLLDTIPFGIDEALSAGSVALVNLEGDPVWWQLDPDTGAALGMGANGWGESGVEYAIALWAVVFGFAVCDAGADSSVDRAVCVGLFFAGWGAGAAAITSATVAAAVLAVITIILGLVTPVIDAHSR